MTTKEARKVVACVPAYNEEKTIAKVLVRASRHVDRLLVVDDGSEDDTGLISEKLGALVIRHSRNLGKGAAIGDCLDWAKKNDVDILVTLDADGQHDPDEIPSMIGPIVTGQADIAVGGRLSRPTGMTRTRRFAQKTLDTLAGVREGGILVDSQSGFRAYSRRAILGIEISEWSMGAESEILLEAKRAGLRIHQVPVRIKYDLTEARRRNSVVQFMDVFSTIVKVALVKRPLRVIGLPGLLLLLVGLFGWLDVLATFNSGQGFALGHALIYTTIILAGTVVTITGILVFVTKIMLQQAR